MLVLHNCSLPARWNIGIGPGWWLSHYPKERLVNLNFLRGFSVCFSHWLRPFCSQRAWWLVFIFYILMSISLFFKKMAQIGILTHGKEKRNQRAVSFSSNGMCGQANISSSSTGYEWVPTHHIKGFALVPADVEKLFSSSALSQIALRWEFRWWHTSPWTKDGRLSIPHGELSPLEFSKYSGSVEHLLGAVKVL